MVLKYLPLLFVAVVGWFFVSKANFGAFNASGGSLYSAIGIAAGVALFSFIGVETAAITAKRVKDPRRNVGRASLLGTGAAAIVYLAVSAAVMGLVSHHALVNNGAPFVNAFETIFPHAAWAGKLVAALAAVSGFGALIGWTLVTAEVSRAQASDRLFPRRSPGPTATAPPGSASWSRRAAVAADAVALHDQLRADGVHLPGRPDRGHRGHPVPVLGLRPAHVPGRQRRPVQGWALARDLTITVAAVLFSLWVTFAAGYSAVYQAMVVVLAGIILYAFVRAHREPASAGPGASRPSGRGDPRREPGGTVMTFSVQSEAGQLRQAIIHRPGLELSRLTPQNIGDLLFDDVLWANKAKEEHDVFAEILRDHGVQVHYFGQLLAEVTGAARGPGLRTGPGVHTRVPGPGARRPAPRAVRGPRRATAGRVPDRRGTQGRPEAAADQEPEMGHAARR